MKKKSFILIAVMCIAAMMMSLLAGCSGEGTSKAGTPLSENLNADGIHIWYECQNKIENKDSGDTYTLEEIMGEEEDTTSAIPQFGRETRVVWVKVYNAGKLTTYSCIKNVYLGFFAKMTDEEIVKALESDKDTFLCGQKDEPYEIYLYSDATGHEIVFEGIPSIIKQGKKKDPMYFMTLVSSQTVPAFQVYDSYYGGYMLYNYDETLFGEACLVTRCEEGAVFGLDSMELEGAVIDYATPEDMLHEKNTELNKALKKSKKTDTEESTEEGAEGEDAAEGEADVTEGDMVDEAAETDN